jgi:hypothetical protein
MTNDDRKDIKKAVVNIKDSHREYSGRMKPQNINRILAAGALKSECGIKVGQLSSGKSLTDRELHPRDVLCPADDPIKVGELNMLI